MKKLSGIFALFLSAVLMVTAFIQSAAAENENTEYVITNPYENVDWNSVRAYKTALHTHTNASDGRQTLRESIERHVETDFDIVAVTDHGTVNYSWEDKSENKFIYGVMSLVGKSKGELDYLGQSGEFKNGTKYTLTAKNGNDYLETDSGKTVLRVPYGIENNAVSVNAHVNSWFVDYHDNSITTYKDAIRGVDRAGGVCVINHPGEYTKARYEIRSENAYDFNEYSYSYYVNKFASLIDKYDACIGIDINSKGDSRTRFDRILWDELLTRFSAKGENVYAIASSDAHQLDKIDTGFILALCEDQTSASLEKSLRNGEFLAASHCIGNYDELVSIADGIKQHYGETELYNKIMSTAEAMKAKIEGIENGAYDADESIGITYSVLDSAGYCTAKTQPAVKEIKTEGDTIKITSENADIVRWISNGEVLSTTKAGESEFSVSDYSSKVGNYVRAEIFGEGGIIYTQAFLINADEKDENIKVTKGIYVDMGVLDFLLAEFGKWGDIISRYFKNAF